MSGKSSVVACVGILLLFAGGLAAAQEEAAIKPGTVITMQNWQNYKDYLPAGLQLMFDGKTPWKLEPDYRMVIGPTHNYRWP
ncbi:MAG TPA: hypothetical protein VMD75_01860, partial [Candidatus Binataceae bacterium]|nr:hypothetical protein [Candidatus Binataceae bacterium]